MYVKATASQICELLDKYNVEHHLLLILVTLYR